MCTLSTFGGEILHRSIEAEPIEIITFYHKLFFKRKANSKIRNFFVFTLIVFKAWKILLGSNVSSTYFIYKHNICTNISLDKLDVNKSSFIINIISVIFVSFKFWLQSGYHLTIYFILFCYSISSQLLICVKDVSVGLLRQCRQCTNLLYFSRNSSENSSNSLTGDGDDTEILVNEGTIQTVNTDDLGIQTSIEGISQLVDQSKTITPVEEKNETTEEQQIISGKMIGTNDLPTTIVIFVVILNDHRHYFLKISLIRDYEGNFEISIACPI